MTLDLVEEKFHAVPLADNYGDKRNGIIHFGGLEGLLCIVLSRFGMKELDCGPYG